MFWVYYLYTPCVISPVYPRVSFYEELVLDIAGRGQQSTGRGLFGAVRGSANTTYMGE